MCWYPASHPQILQMASDQLGSAANCQTGSGVKQKLVVIPAELLHQLGVYEELFFAERHFAQHAQIGQVVQIPRCSLALGDGLPRAPMGEFLAISRPQQHRSQCSLHCTIHPELICLATGRGIGNDISKNIGNVFDIDMSFYLPMLLIYNTFSANIGSQTYRQKSTLHILVSSSGNGHLTHHARRR